jgi:hypothetical protein
MIIIIDQRNFQLRKKIKKKYTVNKLHDLFDKQYYNRVFIYNIILYKMNEKIQFAYYTYIFLSYTSLSCYVHKHE